MRGILDSLQNGANWLGNELGPGTGPGAFYYPNASPGITQAQAAQDYIAGNQFVTDYPYNAVASAGRNILFYAGVGIILVSLLTSD